MKLTCFCSDARVLGVLESVLEIFLDLGTLAFLPTENERIVYLTFMKLS